VAEALSRGRRRDGQRHQARRLAEESTRQRVAAICQFAGSQHVPVVQVTRCLAVSDRTVRRWRQQACAAAPTCLATRGRPAQPAQRADRNAVYQFLRERGAGTPLVAVQAAYARLFAEHGPPLVLKSDNGGQFRDERTKRLLAEYDVVPLYNPRRRPAYNGGVERANGQLAGYQEAVAAAQGRPGLPTRADAEQARHLANDLARPTGWRGPTAAQLWEQRQPLTVAEREVFLAAVDARRLESRQALHFSPTELLAHYAQAAVDRRAVRDALVAQGLLTIEPRHKRTAPAPATQQPAQLDEQENNKLQTTDAQGAGRIPGDSTVDTPMVGVPTAPEPNVGCPGTQPIEEAHSSTNKSSASGQH